MKKRFTILAITVFVLGGFLVSKPYASDPLSYFPISVKGVRQFVNLMPGSMGAPTTTFKIEVETCKTVTNDDFSVVVKKGNDTARQADYYLVGFVDKNPIDCFGPAHLTRLKLETVEIPRRGRVIVTNPLRVEEKVAH